MNEKYAEGDKSAVAETELATEGFTGRNTDVKNVWKSWENKSGESGDKEVWPSHITGCLAWRDSSRMMMNIIMFKCLSAC